MIEELLNEGSELYVFQPAWSCNIPSSWHPQGNPSAPGGGKPPSFITPIRWRGLPLGSNLEPLTFPSSSPEVKTLGMMCLTWDDADKALSTGSFAHVQLHPPMEKELDQWPQRWGQSASSIIADGTSEWVFLRVPTGNGSQWRPIDVPDNLENAKSLQPSKHKRTGWGWSGAEEMPCTPEELPSQGRTFARHVDDGKTTSVALKSEGNNTRIFPATVIKPGCTAVESTASNGA